MSKRKYKDFDTIDDYYEEEGDSFLLNQSVGSDLSNVSYEDFNKSNRVYDYDEGVVYREKESPRRSVEDQLIENQPLMGVLTIFWTWFRRLGIVIAIILVFYYLVHGMFEDLFAYIVALVVAFLFGFGFMAVFTKLKDHS